MNLLFMSFAYWFASVNVLNINIDLSLDDRFEGLVLFKIASMAFLVGALLLSMLYLSESK